MIQKCNKTAIHQLIIIELVDKVLSKFSEQAIELINQFGLNEKIIQQVEWEEDYKSYTLQELENPYLYLRKTKQLYQYTKEQYEMIKNKFRRQWEEKLTEILSQGRQRKPQPSIYSHPHPPPPPFRRNWFPLNKTPEFVYIKYPCTLIENNIDGTIWKAPLQNKKCQIKEELIKLFIKKAKKQQITKPEKLVIQKEVVEYGPSVINNFLGIEILRKRLQKINLDEILEQVNQLEFLAKNYNIVYVRTIFFFDLLTLAIEQLQNSDLEFAQYNVRHIQYNIKKAKEDSQNYLKQQLEEEDQLSKQEIERFKSLSIEGKLLAIQELDQILNRFQDELQIVHGEIEIQQIVSELDPKLEQFRKDLNITQLDEQHSEILFQIESVLLEKYKLLKQKRLRSQDKFQINLNDRFLLYIYDRNPRKGIQIEAFYKEHLESKIHIYKTVTQYSEVFKELKKDEELIMYFQYIKEYGKVFNNIEVNEFGFKFENMINFSYKTQQLEGNQEELIKYIVELMMDQGIPFKELEHTPFKHLSILSKPNNDLSEILNFIKVYKDHLIFLEENLKVLSQDEKNNDFIQKAQKYAQEYKDLIYQMDTFYEEDQKHYKQIRHFLCDDRPYVNSPKFFEDILTIKTLLRNYYKQIIQRRRKQQILDLARSRRI